MGSESPGFVMFEGIIMVDGPNTPNTALHAASTARDIAEQKRYLDAADRDGGYGPKSVMYVGPLVNLLGARIPARVSDSPWSSNGRTPASDMEYLRANFDAIVNGRYP